MGTRAEPEPFGAVIVLSWHGRDDTLACVASLMADPAGYRVLVVDNGSDDGVLEAVQAQWPGTATLQTGENLGYAGGMNVGLRWALDQGAAFVTVLNNDTVVPAGAIARLQDACGRTRALSPEVAYLDRPDRLWFGGGAIETGTLLPHHVAQEQLGPGTPLRASTVLAGCCITASADVWRTVGGFDERFFLNFEDSEWSLRAREHGVELAVDPRVRIGHGVSASFARAPAYVGSYYYARNGLLFNRIAGGTFASRVRFLRRHVLPSARQRLRDGGVRGGARAGLVLLVAGGHYVFRRFGRAPAWLERLRPVALRKATA